MSDYIRQNVSVSDSDPVDVEAGYVDGRKVVTGSSSEVDVDFEDPDGNGITTTISGQEYVDMRHFDRVSVRVDADINSNSNSVDGKIYSRLVEEASEETVASATTVSAGSSTYLIQSLDASDIGWLRVTQQNGDGSDHRFTLLGV